MFIIRNVFKIFLFTLNTIAFSTTIYSYLWPFEITISAGDTIITTDSFVLYLGILLIMLFCTAFYMIGKIANISTEVKLFFASRKKRKDIISKL